MGFLWRAVEWIGLVLGAGIAGIAILFLLARRRILRRVATDLVGESLLLSAGAYVGISDGVNGKTHSSGAAGILMLFASGLYFRSWVGSREVFVSGPAISWIGVAEPPQARPPERPSHRGRDRPARRTAERPTAARGYGHRIVVRFLNAAGKEDGVTIRLLYPEQWVEAIKTHLIARSS